MVTRVPIDKQTAYWARERCNLSIERAAELLGCKPEHLGKIESGDLQPSATLFRKMASIYLLPEATLLGIVPAAELPLPKDFRAFEGGRIELAYETILAARNTQSRQEALAQLAEIDNQITAPELPIHTMNEDPERLGAAFRREFGFGVVDQLALTTDRAFMRWRMMVEDFGVCVYVEPLGHDDSRGLSVFFNEFPAIVIDQHEKHVGARNFTLFHELAHLLIRQTGVSDQKHSNAVEAFCNRFAAAFIMPAEAIRAVFEVPEQGTIAPGIEELNVASRKLCVTISQVALRLEHLGFAKSGFYSAITKQLKPPKPKPPQAGGDWRYVYVSQYGYKLPAAVFGSLDRGQISSVQASRILAAAPANFAAVKKTLEERRALFGDGHQ